VDLSAEAEPRDADHPRRLPFDGGDVVYFGTLDDGRALPAHRARAASCPSTMRITPRAAADGVGANQAGGAEPYDYLPFF
jgi:hypothetical protein